MYETTVHLQIAILRINIYKYTCMKLLFISSTPYHHLHGRRERERGEKEGREYMREDEWMLVQNLLIPY